MVLIITTASGEGRASNELKLMLAACPRTKHGHLDRRTKEYRVMRAQERVEAEEIERANKTQRALFDGAVDDQAQR